MPTYCAVCPRETILGCDACKAVLFCSRTCQKLIWSTHQLICKGRVDTLELPDLTKAERDYLTKKMGYTKVKGILAKREYDAWWIRARTGPQDRTSSSLDRMFIFACASGLLHSHDEDGSEGAQRTNLRAAIYQTLPKRRDKGDPDGVYITFPEDFPVSIYNYMGHELGFRTNFEEKYQEELHKLGLHLAAGTEYQLWSITRQDYNATLRQCLVGATLKEVIRTGTKYASLERLESLIELSEARAAESADYVMKKAMETARSARRRAGTY